MRTVTKLEPYNSRIKVYLDDEFSFLLYKGEIRKFHLNENESIGEDTYREIMESLYKRARERVLYILDDSYKTESQIREKLNKGFYPPDIVDKVINYLIEYDLVNDLRYAGMYIEFKSSSKSKKQIVQDLYRKGVSKDNIDAAFEESDYSDEISLYKIIEKRISKYNLNEQQDLQKIYRYLIGKGYCYSDVKKALSKYTNINQNRGQD
ncbi:MAG: regulatory protein RecX [Eubacterium sp.]